VGLRINGGMSDLPVCGAIIAPVGTHVANPAFDITPYAYMTAIIPRQADN